MTRWKDTLPVPQLPEEGDWFTAALLSLVEALDAEAEGDDDAMLMEAGYAAANIRAWRKSLPEQGERHSDFYRVERSDRVLLRAAMHHVLWADAEPQRHLVAPILRDAEAALRTLWRWHQGVAS